jgi:putative membrane protein
MLVPPPARSRAFTRARRLGLAALLLVLALLPRAAQAGPGDASADSLYLIGEFVDPVCIFQHGMQGTLQRQCAMVSGRVEQGMYFLDIRHRKLYTVIGQTHWENPQQGFLEALGDTFAVKGKVWRRLGSSAIAITEMYPYRDQPRAIYRPWPWHFEWSVPLGCALLLVLYGLAMWRLAPRLAPPGERHGRVRALSYVASLIVVLGSLSGPLHDLSDLYLFSAHMIQHLLLAQVFPLLFILGVPPWLWRWLLSPRPLAWAWNAVARLPMGFVLYTIVFSIWHVPALYDLMMRAHGFHIVMHLMVMATAVLMWWPVAGGSAVARPLSQPAQMLYLFLLGTPMMFVAALLTFAERPLYLWYALAPRVIGMSAVDDQRLGGLIMWVPGSLFFWGVMSVVYFQWAARESRADEVLAGETA